MERKCLKCGCEGASEIQVQELRVSIYQDNAARQARKGQNFSVDIVFIRLIDERDRQDSWSYSTERDALDQKNVR